METFGWSLQISLKLWVSVFLFWSVLFSLLSTSLTLHFIMVGLCLIGVSSCRLPRPEAASQVSILGHSSSEKGSGLIAHRCGGLDEHPENTLAALREAKDKGIRCVEFDVSLSSDGVPFVFHDETLDRLAINAKGLFSEYSSAQIASFRVKNKLLHPEEDSTGDCIPRLEEFIQECSRLELNMIMDVKDFYSVKKSANVVLEAFKKYPFLYKSCLVSSFHPGIIYSVRQQDPGIVCGMAWRPYFLSCETYSGTLQDARPRWDALYKHYLASIGDIFLKWAYHNVLWHFLGLSAVLVHKALITPEYVEMWTERGIRVLVWTVNDTLEKLYLSKSLGVTPISDAIDPISEENFLFSICEEPTSENEEEKQS
eukprot:TRINITY_DN4783_c0_g1_i1.p1 TRINITY_DN4783_c0_g1~~TRINITY_DN4783_c0_g1_i1.p1  ORF type:complete len:409 (+),score=84.40 TRINITY_DN4783_c0_g1_i1:121-1227(+)